MQAPGRGSSAIGQRCRAILRPMAEITRKTGHWPANPACCNRHSGNGLQALSGGTIRATKGKAYSNILRLAHGRSYVVNSQHITV